MPEPQPLPKQPLTEELVTADVLASVGTNPIAFSGADNPSTAWRQMLADSPSAFPLYRDLEEKDGQISSALETRKDGVLRRERKVVAVSSSIEDQRHAAFAREVLAAIPNFENILCELLARHAASPTVSYFSLERSDGALIFGVNENGMVRMKPAFGTGLEIDPDSVPTIRVVGGNTNTALRLDSKGTQAVAVNANANSGTGGFEIFSGGATPALRLRLHADAEKLSFANGVSIETGTGAPSGSCTTGSLFLRSDGASGTTLYVCESSAWVAK